MIEQNPNDGTARYVVRGHASLDDWRADRPAHRSYHASRADALATYEALAEPVAEVVALAPYSVVVERPTCVGVTDGYAMFGTRPEAETAARALMTADAFGWVTQVQYTGAWRGYLVMARRRSSRGATLALRTDGTVR